MKKNEKTQNNEIADIFLNNYPKSVCSQGIARHLAIQLPRAISDFRYTVIKLEDYKPLKVNLKSSRCKHGKNGVDYSLTEKGFNKLKDFYYPVKIIDWDTSSGFAKPIYGSPDFSNSPKPHDTATDVSLFQ